jgi:hypothetical protein
MAKTEGKKEEWERGREGGKERNKRGREEERGEREVSKDKITTNLVKCLIDVYLQFENWGSVSSENLEDVV